CVMFGRPPALPLFPYATLFRSGVAGGFVDGDRLAGDGGLVDCGAAVDDGAVGGDVLAGADQEPVADRDGVDVDVAFGAVGRDDGDRKSTRLNSSHVKISYAVFC